MLVLLREGAEQQPAYERGDEAAAAERLGAGETGDRERRDGQLAPGLGDPPAIGAELEQPSPEQGDDHPRGRSDADFLGAEG
jgi:hypothetical protein